MRQIHGVKAQVYQTREEERHPTNRGIECRKQPHVRKASDGQAVNEGRDATSVVGRRLIDPR